MTTKYWVTMTDKFMPGWGQAEGKINKLVLACDTWQEADTVAENASHRSEMKFINLCQEKPCYSKNLYEVSWHDKTDYPKWYEKGYFSS